MIQEVKMYTVICDNCGADSCEGQDFSCWGDASQAHDNAISSEWEFLENKESGDKYYCPNCFDYDDDDNLIIRRPQPTPNPVKSIER